jgi:anti-sigma regulatory factor (Ser/Thr protein kinase)
MEPDQTVPKKARTRFAPESDPNLEELRATCHRQTLVIDKLSDALSAVRGDVGTLQAENAILRADISPPPMDLGPSGSAMIEAVLPLDVQAPSAARFVVADFLSDRLSTRMVETAQLIISELVSNSLRHNTAPRDQAVVVRVASDRETWRLEVEDPGGEGVLAPDPERAAAGRLGMNLVQSLSECWGVEHAADRGTRAWAYLPRAAVIESEGRNGASA